METFDVAIIGSGPAGLTAGIYALRKGLKIKALEKKMAGGNTADSVLVENYPGFRAIKGIDLANKMLEHFQGLGGKVDEGLEVENAVKKGNEFELGLSDGSTLTARSLIIATGTTHKKLRAENAEKLEGKGIHYCATCDGPLYKDRVVAVVGGGNSGVTNALFLADICKKVFLLEYNDSLRADPVYLEQLKQKGIEIIVGAEVFEVLGEEKVSGLKYKARATGEEKELKLDAIFVYVGLKPNSRIASQLGCKTNKHGYVSVDGWMNTSVEGVFAAGDITGNFAQTIVACGQGAIAAESAYRYLNSPKISES